MTDDTIKFPGPETPTAKQQAIPYGFCRDCRFAQEWPDGEFDPELVVIFPYRCHGSPPVYRLVQTSNKIVGNSPTVQVQLDWPAAMKRPVDFCSWFVPRECP